MISPVKLIVGLGNPGKKYEKTRHTLGYGVIDTLKQDPDAPLQTQGIFAFKPDCFMNESGIEVQRKLYEFRCVSQQLLVVCDDFSIPLGNIRIRLEGSSGGHNGLDSIIKTLGTQDIPRLRIGIGPVPSGVDPAMFVLEDFTKEEEEASAAQISKAVQAIKTIITEGFSVAMNRFNGVPA